MCSDLLSNRVSRALSYFQSVQSEYEHNRKLLDEYGERMNELREEQSKFERVKDVMAAVRQTLTKSSLEYCEHLATLALRDVFQLAAKVHYSPDDGKFLIQYENGQSSDLLSAESGGIKTVVSFVLTVYLTIKTGSRRLMFFDEQWTQVSDEHMPRFLEFVRGVCRDLDFDILLITHDSRITPDDVDTAFFMSGGKCQRLK